MAAACATSAYGGASGAVDGYPLQIVRQLYGLAVTAAWSAVVSAAILLVLKRTIGLRVSEHGEREGLDIHAHGESIL